MHKGYTASVIANSLTSLGFNCQANYPLSIEVIARIAFVATGFQWSQSDADSLVAKYVWCLMRTVKSFRLTFFFVLSLVLLQQWLCVWAAFWWIWSTEQMERKVDVSQGSMRKRRMRSIEKERKRVIPPDEISMLCNAILHIYINTIYMQMFILPWSYWT